MISGIRPYLAPTDLGKLEGDVARHKASRDEAQLGFDDAARRVGEAERRIAELNRDIQAVARKDRTFERWMAVTNWAGRAMAAGAVVGMAVLSSNPLLGAGLFIGGLGGFAASYLFQMKARVRHAEIMSEAVPMARRRDDWQGVHEQASGEMRTFGTRVESAERARQEVQGRLDVVRMAHAEAPSGSVEVADDTVRLGGITIPRRPQPTPPGA